MKNFKNLLAALMLAGTLVGGLQASGAGGGGGGTLYITRAQILHGVTDTDKRRLEYWTDQCTLAEGRDQRLALLDRLASIAKTIPGYIASDKFDRLMNEIVTVPMSGGKCLLLVTLLMHRAREMFPTPSHFRAFMESDDLINHLRMLCTNPQYIAQICADERGVGRLAKKLSCFIAHPGTLVRTRSLVLADRAHGTFDLSPDKPITTLQWLCARAPLWVVMRVVELLMPAGWGQEPKTLSALPTWYTFPDIDRAQREDSYLEQIAGYDG